MTFIRASSRRWLPVIMLLSMLFLMSIGSCRATLRPNVVEVPATANCSESKGPCVAVSKSFIQEHDGLFRQVIRLKAALKQCRQLTF